MGPADQGAHAAAHAAPTPDAHADADTFADADPDAGTNARTDRSSGRRRFPHAIRHLVADASGEESKAVLRGAIADVAGVSKSAVTIWASASARRRRLQVKASSPTTKSS